ncbi:MAG: outer membrane protein assembly factor BamE [Bordetella sp.]|jgi:outer membrane protein assembly factor BamE
MKLLFRPGLRRFASYASLSVGVAGLSACGLSHKLVNDPPSWLTPYRVDIGQGNLITQPMVDQLKAGMSRDQVRSILGTPLLVDPFRTNRWDYVFELRKAGRPAENRRFFVEFEGDQLSRWSGDDLPKDLSDIALPAPAAR